ncbi:ABC transporter ATP-binding protein [Paenibacillus eucommiae]|uniref:ATP-binding cassette subfamily B protein n=1 Tax=Paenibacillus eucommiae TaxID=1355755 RepID=A0ABS4IPS3_9BACL|nr:ABC transporter ATP-binding protein [Paenibacillus eucommiae]MBP1989559.1 ATP-binding cassette subfamily B protein [Paenibacillus eucommiae]
MISKADRRSIKQDLHFIQRGCTIIRQISPGFLELSIVKSMFNAITPYISIYMLAVIIDELLGNRNLNLLAFYVGVTIGGTLLMTVIAEWVSKQIMIMNEMFEARFQNFLNDKTLTMDFTKLEDPKCTELREKIMGNMYAAGGGVKAIIEHIASIVESSISVIIAIMISAGAITATAAAGSGITGAVNSIWFSLLLIAGIIFCIVLTVKNSRSAKMKEFELFQNGAKINGYIAYYNYFYLEDDQAGKDVRIFDQRKLIIDEVLTKGRLPWLNVVNGTYSLNQKYLSLNSAISALIGGFIYIFIGLKALSGTISIGSVTQSYAAIFRLVSAVGSLSVSLSKIRSNNNYLELLYEFIDLPSDMHEGKEIPVISDAGWEIEFHDVSFRYPSCEEYALKNLTIKLSSNSRTAIVGMNGSGKSTMIKLLCRLYSPGSGYITLNGKDIKKYDYNAYVNLFSVVFQDFQLLAFPIGQNVAVSKDYDEEKVWRSLEKAGIADRVRELPLHVGQSIYKNFEEDGVDISGGEAQKIALARAIYKDAPIVVLDEPTAALDPISEFEVYSKFNEMIGSKTALFISHRLSSCRFCDQIAVFHDGQIVQLGTHVELLKISSGKYFELWNAQAQYYAEKSEGISGVC